MSKAAQNFNDKCKRYFQEADKDGNNCLSICELETIIRKLCNRPDVGDKMIANIFADMDKDKSKTLTWDEFANVLLRSPREVEQNELRELFKQCDADGSGLLTVDEIKKAFQELGISSDPQESLDAVDKKGDGDGKVSVDEFLAMWAQNC